MDPLLIVELGLISYTEAFALQNRIVEARKLHAIDDVLLLCQHPHVLTIGRNGKRENLLASEHVLRHKGVEFHGSNRGGDITYHGPGQIVGYPILDLARIKQDVHWYVRSLEEVLIRVSGDFGITAFRIPGRTGIWVDAKPHEEKLAAIGVHISRWVTSHGFAYNVATDLRYFDLIVPCGIAQRKVTSLEKLLDRSVLLDEVEPDLIHHFVELFGMQPRTLSFGELNSALGNHALAEGRNVHR